MINLKDNKKIVVVQDKPEPSYKRYSISQAKPYSTESESDYFVKILHTGLRQYITNNIAPLVLLTEMIDKSDPQASSLKMFEEKRKKIHDLIS